MDNPREGKCWPNMSIKYWFLSNTSVCLFLDVQLKIINCTLPCQCIWWSLCFAPLKNLGKFTCFLPHIWFLSCSKCIIIVKGTLDTSWYKYLLNEKPQPSCTKIYNKSKILQNPRRVHFAKKVDLWSAKLVPRTYIPRTAREDLNHQAS